MSRRHYSKPVRFALIVRCKYIGDGPSSSDSRPCYHFGSGKDGTVRKRPRAGLSLHANAHRIAIDSYRTIRPWCISGCRTNKSDAIDELNDPVAILITLK